MVDFSRLAISEREIDLFLSFVRKQRGLDLTYYRKTFIARRLKVRFNSRNVDNLTSYIALLRKDPREWNSFLDNLSINVSEFFRDREVFESFRKKCVPEMIDRKQAKGNKVIRCWSCGCSCGEEAYSLAILLYDYLEKADLKEFVFKIYATDVDEDALSKAETGEYEKRSIKNLSPGQLGKHFVHLPGGRYRVRDYLKHNISFKKQNLLVDQPLKFMDVVFFRNVRIYFKGMKADEVLRGVYSSLKKDGYLVLGKVETVGVSLNNLVERVDLNNKIFRKL